MGKLGPEPLEERRVLSVTFVDGVLTIDMDGNIGISADSNNVMLNGNPLSNPVAADAVHRIVANGGANTESINLGTVGPVDFPNLEETELNASPSVPVSIAGSAFRDVITGSDGDDYISGNGGDDDISAGGSTDYDFLDGGFGNDTLRAGSGRSALFGSVGEDKFYGGSGISEIEATDSGGIDTIYPDSGICYIAADSVDVIEWTVNGNLVPFASTPHFALIANLESGDHTVDIDGSEVVVDDGTVDEAHWGFTGYNFVGIGGNSGSDTVTITVPSSGTFPATNVRLGRGGDSLTIDAPSTNDTINLSSSSVVVNGNTIAYGEVETMVINAGAGNDAITVTKPSSGALPKILTVAGGADADALTLDSSAVEAEQLITITASKVGEIFYSGVETKNVVGGASNDKISINGSLGLGTLKGGGGTNTYQFVAFSTGTFTIDQTGGLNDALVFGGFTGVTVDLERNDRAIAP